MQRKDNNRGEKLSNLLATYNKEIVPKLQEEFKIKNTLALPLIKKVVINVGASEALTSKDILSRIKEQLAIISGQNPRVTLAKKSISTFKLKQNDQIGVMVTLRGKKAWDFLEKFIKIVVPRIRDFRGFSKDKFDSSGNYSIGISEQSIFPYLEYSKIDKTRGLVVSIVVKNGNEQISPRFFELLGLPFKK